MRRIAFGERPALVKITSRMWTRPGNPLTREEMDVIIPKVQPCSARRGAGERYPGGLHDDGLRSHRGRKH
jgi:hypothetical protein